MRDIELQSSIPESLTAYRRMRNAFLTKVGQGKIECVNCGCNIPELLEVNHKKGGGGIERKSFGNSGSGFRRAVMSGKRTIDDLELTCRVCNALHYLEFTHGKKLPYKISFRK
jgi:hypothetical protein